MQPKLRAHMKAKSEIRSQGDPWLELPVLELLASTWTCRRCANIESIQLHKLVIFSNWRFQSTNRFDRWRNQRGSWISSDPEICTAIACPGSSRNLPQPRLILQAQSLSSSWELAQDISESVEQSSKSLKILLWKLSLVKKGVSGWGLLPLVLKESFYQKNSSESAEVVNAW